MKTFLIRFEENKKYSKIRQNTLIQLSSPTGDLGRDAQSALNIFISQFGNLKKNKIIFIQELDSNGDAVGEPIVPREESTVVPLYKEK